MTFAQMLDPLEVRHAKSSTCANEIAAAYRYVAACCRTWPDEARRLYPNEEGTSAKLIEGQLWCALVEVGLTTDVSASTPPPSPTPPVD